MNRLDLNSCFYDFDKQNNKSNMLDMKKINDFQKLIDIFQNKLGIKYSSFCRAYDLLENINKSIYDVKDLENALVLEILKMEDSKDNVADCVNKLSDFYCDFCDDPNHFTYLDLKQHLNKCKELLSPCNIKNNWINNSFKKKLLYVVDIINNFINGDKFCISRMENTNMSLEDCNQYIKENVQLQQKSFDEEEIRLILLNELIKFLKSIVEKNNLEDYDLIMTTDQKDLFLEKLSYYAKSYLEKLIASIKFDKKFTLEQKKEVFDQAIKDFPKAENLWKDIRKSSFDKISVKCFGQSYANRFFEYFCNQLDDKENISEIMFDFLTCINKNLYQEWLTKNYKLFVKQSIIILSEFTHKETLEYEALVKAKEEEKEAKKLEELEKKDYKDVEINNNIQNVKKELPSEVVMFVDAFVNNLWFSNMELIKKIESYLHRIYNNKTPIRIPDFFDRYGIQIDLEDQQMFIEQAMNLWFGVEKKQKKTDLTLNQESWEQLESDYKVVEKKDIVDEKKQFRMIDDWYMNIENSEIIDWFDANKFVLMMEELWYTIENHKQFVKSFEQVVGSDCLLKSRIIRCIYFDSWKIKRAKSKAINITYTHRLFVVGNVVKWIFDNHDIYLKKLSSYT